METSKKFHLEVKNYVDRILIYLISNNKSIFHGEMIFSVEIPENKSKIFNGMIPNGYNIIVKLLIGEYKTQYIFSDLFSLPVKFENYQNTIVVNTPKNIDTVIIEVPNKLNHLLKIQNIITLLNTEHSKIKLFTDDDDLKNKGIDPTQRNFIKFVNLNLSYIKELKIEKEANTILENTFFNILCYEHSIYKKIKF